MEGKTKEGFSHNKNKNLQKTVIKKQQTTKCFKLCKKQHWYRWREMCPSIAYILTITSRYFKRELAIFGKGMASSKQRNTSNSK